MDKVRSSFAEWKLTMLKRFPWLFAALLFAAPALAQNEFPTPTAGKTVIGVQLMCQNGSAQSVPCGPLASLSISGWAPSGAWATLTAASGASSAATALPSGSPPEIIVYNNGAYPASVKLGAGTVAATAANDIVPAGGAIALSVGANTDIAGWGIGGASALVVSGGSGIPVGWGGGGGGGGGGSVTQGTSPWVISGAVTGTFWQTTQPISTAGTTGLDYSANKPTLPNVGANFAASGPYASYFLIATVPASATRNSVDIENTSGAQIAIIRDDGTAAAAAAPVNASVFALAPGAGVGAQGGSWSSMTFKGRLQIYAASSAAQVAIMVE
jgi:hypothetical protein